MPALVPGLAAVQLKRLSWSAVQVTLYLMMLRLLIGRQHVSFYVALWCAKNLVNENSNTAHA